MSFVQRFLFDHLDIQGAFVWLDDVFVSLLERRHYPLHVAQTLGEVTAAASIIAARMKANARLSFQMKAQAPISSLFVDIRRHAQDNEETLFIRGMAKPASNPVKQKSATLQTQADDFLLMNLELPNSNQPYQSFVPLNENRIAAIFTQFLAHSEQTDVFLKTAVHHSAASALFFQAMPQAHQKDPDGFNRLKILAETLREEEMLTPNCTQIFERIFAEDRVNLRIFNPQTIRYHCPYEPSKILNILKSMEKKELEKMLHENGNIHIHDDICNHDYVFVAEDIFRLFDR